MRIRYWGVRGSIATPGPATVRVGGNTACVSVEIDAGVLVIDAGTGIRGLGELLKDDAREVFLLFTHRHADHVQGLAFFAPIAGGAQPVHLLDMPTPDGGAWTALETFDGISNPLTREQLSAGTRRAEGDAMDWLAGRGVRLSRFAARHPGGCWGYRLDEGGRSYVHLTDNELGEQDDAFLESCAAFCSGADVLCHDAQYLRSEMPVREGWGHTSAERACELAVASNARRLLLFHHDPVRCDDEVEAVEARARETLQPHGIGCDAAREGMSIDL